MTTPESSSPNGPPSMTRGRFARDSAKLQLVWWTRSGECRKVVLVLKQMTWEEVLRNQLGLPMTPGMYVSTSDYWARGGKGRRAELSDTVGDFLSKYKNRRLNKKHYIVKVCYPTECQSRAGLEADPSPQPPPTARATPGTSKANRIVQRCAAQSGQITDSSGRGSQSMRVNVFITQINYSGARGNEEVAEVNLANDSNTNEDSQDGGDEKKARFQDSNTNVMRRCIIM